MRLPVQTGDRLYSGSIMFRQLALENLISLLEFAESISDTKMFRRYLDIGNFLGKSPFG